jgi:predicted ATP-binding protein involved in virulence
MGEVAPYNIHKALAFNKVTQDANQLLQAIANMKLQSAMDFLNEIKNSNNLISRLESTISDITGRKFSFKVTSHPQMKISVQWGDEIMNFNSLPDGLRIIIGWLAHAAVTTDLYWKGEKDPTKEEAIFLFDEIETHLHPAWQRKILPAFQKLFPKAQIFVATHSPFVISSLNEGWIYKLQADAKGKVTISEPIPASKGDSYITAVEDILGVDEWYDTETEALLQQFRDHRDAGIKGNESEREKAISLAQNISERSHELAVMMGAEIKQLNKILAS